MTKHLVKISVLLLWLGLMGWWWHESRSWPVPEKIDAAFLPDYSDYYGLSFSGQKIGWANKSLRRISEGGYQGIQSLSIRLASPDKSRLTVEFSVVATFDRVLNLTDFRYIVKAGQVVLTESGRVETAADGQPEPDGPLLVEFNLGEYEPLFQSMLAEYGHLLGPAWAEHLDLSRPARLARPSGPVLVQFLPSYLSYLGLTPGHNYSFETFDPTRRTLVPVNVRVEAEDQEYDLETGRKIPVFRVRLTEAGGSSLVWIDRHGRTIREEALGFKLERVVSLESKNLEPGLAAKGARPLALPPAVQNLFSNPEIKALLEQAQEPERDRKRRKPRRTPRESAPVPAEAGAPGPEKPAEAGSPDGEKK